MNDICGIGLLARSRSGFSSPFLIIAPPSVTSHGFVLRADPAMPLGWDPTTAEKSMLLSSGCLNRPLSRVLSAGSRWNGRLFSGALSLFDVLGSVIWGELSSSLSCEQPEREPKM